MKRDLFLSTIEQYRDINPITAILGPRQCGKTTLAHQFAERESDKGVKVTTLDHR